MNSLLEIFETRVLVEVSHMPIVPIAPQVMLVVVTTTTSNNGLGQKMRQLVELMKNLNLNMLGKVGNNGRHAKLANPSSGEGHPKNGGG